MPTLSLNTTAWTSDERTMFVASVVGVCATLGVSIVGHSQARHVWNADKTVITSSIDLPNASDISGLTEAAIRAKYQSDLAAREAAQAAYEAEVVAQESYVGTDPILNAKVADIIAYVNQTRTDVTNAGNVTALRAACLRIITIEENILKLLYARGLIGVR